jgi:glucosylceramidase
MKTNNDMCHGGSLRLDCYDVYARYLVRFLQSYAAEGFPISYLTVQNESEAHQTFPSCQWTAAQQAAFVRDHLGPALLGAGLTDLKVLVWDHNRDHWEFPVEVLSDPGAAQYIWGSAWHGYEGELGPKMHANLSKVHEAFPDKAILFTEQSDCDPPNFSLLDGERYARWILGDLNNWSQGWIYWNMVLDETGGPNHYTWDQDALVVVRRQEHTAFFEGEYYALAHFSRYARPGGCRVHLEGMPDGVEAAAFLNPDGTCAVQILNTTDRDLELVQAWPALSFTYTAPAHSLGTVIGQVSGRH